MSRAVVHVGLAVVAFKARQTGALVGMVADLVARAAVEALRGRAGQRDHLARAPAVARLAAAGEGAVRVLAHAAVQALARLAALVHVVAAVLALEARRAGAVVVVVGVDAAGAVGTGAGGTGVDQRAVLASESSLAHAGVLGDAIGHLALTHGTVEARRTVTRVLVLAEVPNEAWSAHAFGVYAHSSIFTRSV